MRKQKKYEETNENMEKVQAMKSVEIYIFFI